MKYNPFKYWYHRTKYYLKQPLAWFVESIILSVFFVGLILEGALSTLQTMIFILGLYVVWKTFTGFLRFIVSLIVCFTAKHHEGFKQEYYDCIHK